MITDEEFLSQIQRTYLSLESIRQAILTLSRQNLALLRIAADVQSNKPGAKFKSWLRGLTRVT